DAEVSNVFHAGSFSRNGLARLTDRNSDEHHGNAGFHGALQNAAPQDACKSYGDNIGSMNTVAISLLNSDWFVCHAATQAKEKL
ncbi:MAG: hypothetical protein ACI93T_003989, partial [Porticoccaceae bacterium]